MGTKNLPDLVFKLTEEKFKSLSGGDVELLPGFTTVFDPRVEKKVLDSMMNEMLDFLHATGNVQVKYTRTTVQRNVKGPAFAVVTYADGVMIET
jgi:hypothetical protein